MFCHTARVVLAGEVVAQSDGIASRTDSNGRQATVLLTASTLDHMGDLSAQILQFGNFVAAQNQTTFTVSQTESTASCAKSNSWTDERYNPISDTFSTWTQILIISRSVFFGPLDDGMSASFATLIFGCAAILFLNVHIPDVVVNVPISSPSSATAGSQETETDDGLSSEYGTDGVLSVRFSAAFALSTECSEEDKADYGGSYTDELSDVFPLPTISARAHGELSDVFGQESGIGRHTVEEEDPVVLLCQDPESISLIPAGDVEKF